MLQLQLCTMMLERLALHQLPSLLRVKPATPAAVALAAGVRILSSFVILLDTEKMVVSNQV
jgi:hypothetical protein